MVSVSPLILAAALLTQAPDPAHAPAPRDKKQAYLLSKTDAPRSKRSPRPGQRAHAPIWSHNLRTHEITTLTGPGAASSEGRDRHFRCWFTTKHTDVPDALVDRVIATARHFDTRAVMIISGFRHPKYNLSLVKKGREVARDSEHTRGQAIDFFLPGVETRRLYDHLLATHEGGVGFYPVSAFVHVDLGRRRTWRGT